MSIFSIATSGLLAYQAMLRTSGNNVANANTPGYSRQRVEVSTLTPQLGGAGYLGNGVGVDTVERYYDRFLTDRLVATTSTMERYDTYGQFAGRVADLLGDPTAGLNGGLETFFSAVQGVADNPGSIPERQLMLTEAEALAARFSYIDDQLQGMRRELNGQLEATVAEINTLSQSIADINEDIVVASGQAGGNAPNDLLDRRDQMIQDLARLVSVKTVTQDDGSVNVFIGNGQSLVTGFTAAALSVTGSKYDGDIKEISYSVGGSTTPITSNISGGRLGGLLAFRDDILEPSRNAVGRIGVVLAQTFNQQHKLGMDLNGNMGGDFFDSASPAVNADPSNSGSATLAVSYDLSSIQDLTTQDYILSYDGSNWSLKTTDGTAVSMSGSGTSASPFNFDGVDVVVSGTASAGDSFLIRPTRDGARDFGLALGDVRAIAAAAPVRVTEATDANGLPTNTGDGSFRLQSVTSDFTTLSGSITFTFDDTTNTFSYTDGGSLSGTISYDPAADNGSTYTVGEVSFRVTGTPDNGDSFVVSSNTGGAGDNANALALAALQTADKLEGGTTNLQGAYGQLIGDMATQTRQAEINYDAQQALNRQAQAARDSLSGVNLDEEAANLIRYQQAYQAMARVVTVADTMFQTLLSAVQR